MIYEISFYKVFHRGCRIKALREGLPLSVRLKKAIFLSFTFGEISNSNPDYFENETHRFQV
jgi:hypothetical protein